MHWLTLLVVAAGCVSRVSGQVAHPPDNAFFSTAHVEEHATQNTDSEGDLWASCWGDDDRLYAANGDGGGFTRATTRPDIAVSRISGGPGALTGSTLAVGDAVAGVWTPGGDYNRKPTGMVCADGILYLAVQDLSKDFNDAPVASISRSADHGVTWQWDAHAPMFSGHTFTTIMFLDYGRDNQESPDGYVYAYGLDGNWRASYSHRAADPTKLFLARVPGASVQTRSAWRFYSGLDASGSPVWSPEITARAPVLEDGRRVYRHSYDPRNPHDLTVLSQGGIVYDKPLRRYLYTSWTEYTFEFYEAPQPWGPWKHFLTKDFGEYPWTADKNGGYATTIPSKFMSQDGRTMFVQSNTFVGGAQNYGFSLRKLVVAPYVPASASNPRSDTDNLAVSGEGATPISKSAHYGNLSFLNNGRTDESEDDWDLEAKAEDWWGYDWDRPYFLNKVVYTTGEMFPAGGWYRSNLHVQVRQKFRWVDVKGLTVSPDYPYDQTTGPHRTYTLTFHDTVGNGVRIVGTPGGSASFTSISELGVFYADAAMSSTPPARGHHPEFTSCLP